MRLTVVGPVKDEQPLESGTLSFAQIVQMVSLIGDCIPQDPFGVALLENLSGKSDSVTWKHLFSFQSMGCELGCSPLASLSFRTLSFLAPSRASHWHHASVSSSDN